MGAIPRRIKSAEKKAGFYAITRYCREVFNHHDKCKVIGTRLKGFNSQLSHKLDLHFT
jgi:hypothetical protein